MNYNIMMKFCGLFVSLFLCQRRVDSKELKLVTCNSPCSKFKNPHNSIVKVEKKLSPFLNINSAYEKKFPYPVELSTVT